MSDQKRNLSAALVAAAFFLCGNGLLWAQTQEKGQEEALEAERQQADKDLSSAEKESERSVLLAKQYSVDTATVQKMRDDGNGWGEINIRLAMAQYLNRTDPKAYPTLGDALTKIGMMRGQGSGYGRIAKDLGFKLGPVVSGAKRAREGVHSQAHMGTHPTKGAESRRGLFETGVPPEKPGRFDRPERVSGFNRADRSHGSN